MFNMSYLRQFLLGLLIGATIAALFLIPDKTNILLESIYSLTLIIATIFTAYWTSKTFTYNPKREEAKEISAAIKHFLDRVSEYESMKPLRDTLAEQELVSDEVRENWKNRSREIERNLSVSRDVLHDLFLSSNYISKVTALFAAGDLPFKFDNADFDEIRKKFWKYDSDIRKDAFFTIDDQVRKFKKYFGF